jgi:lipoyl(octanoyl) transferase
MPQSLNSPCSCLVQDLGAVTYDLGYQAQLRAFHDVLHGAPNVLILCEHFPVYTVGRSGKDGNFLCSAAEIQKLGACKILVNRGGQTTFHGPGQLVVYPIFSLNHFGRDLKLFITKNEQVVIDLLQDFGIVANRILGSTGVWVAHQKIASLGFGVKKWITFHGLGLNVNTDLRFFDMIKPCGLDIQMTSIKNQLGRPIEMDQIKKQIIFQFQQQFSLDFLK